MTFPILSGQGGKSGGGGQANNDPNSMRSRAKATVVIALSEGPIEGLINNARTIFINDSPLKNSDGSVNHEGITWEFHEGSPNGSPLAGAKGVEAYTSVGQTVENGSPVLVTISEAEIDFVKVIARVDSLYTVTKEGIMETGSVTYGFDVRPAGGIWTRAVTNALVNEKTTAPTQIMHKITLPENGAPWDIRMVRDTLDSTDDRIVNGVSFDSYSLVTMGRFTYPHTATLTLSFDAEKVGGSAPKITAGIKARRIKVPTNYNPVTRVYSGVWDGTFKTEFSNCPPWIYYDIITNDIFGVGDFIKKANIDKWSLYAIGQHCDEKIPTGYKKTDGSPILEPRYTYNGVMTSKTEAFFALQAITRTWRGMSYWSRGQVVVTADMPSDPVRNFVPANVIDGRFEYSSTSIKSRKSVIMVHWNDPENNFAPATEVVIDEDLLERYGWREQQVTLEGCSSRSLAHRYGRWILDVEKNETETASFTAAWDSINALPGEIIAIADPRRAQVRMGGRIVSHVQGQIVLDADLTTSVGATYSISVQMPNGSIQSIPVTAIATDKRTLTVAATTDLAHPDAVFVVSGTDVEPRTYRVVSIDESDDLKFAVTALQHDPNKYLRVEQNINLAPRSYMRRNVVARKVTGISADETVSTFDGRWRSFVNLTWSTQIKNLIQEYVVMVDTPVKKNITVGRTSGNSIEYITTEDGLHTFRVVAVPFVGGRSAPTFYEFTVIGAKKLTGHRVQALINDETGLGGTVEFFGRNAEISWKNVFPATTRAAIALVEGDDEDNIRYSHNVVRVYSGTTLLRTVKVIGKKYVYPRELNRKDSLREGFPSARRTLRFEVTVVNTSKEVSTSFAAIEMSNPTPVALVPEISVEGRRIKITIPQPDDEDIEGYKIWVETNNTFDPLTTAAKYNGPSNIFVFTGAPRVTNYHVRVAAYDTFGKTGMVVSPVYAVTTERENIGDNAYVEINGSQVNITDLAAASIIPSLNFVGSFATAPTEASLGADWRQNSLYKNTTNNISYVLTGTPLAWVKYLEDGTSFNLVIESTNGTVFRPGTGQDTLLKARLFKNGAEVTDVTPQSWFGWRRVSGVLQAAPNDDATWNALYASGYRNIAITVDSVYARATFFCDITST